MIFQGQALAADGARQPAWLFRRRAPWLSSDILLTAKLHLLPRGVGDAARQSPAMAGRGSETLLVTEHVARPTDRSASLRRQWKAAASRLPA